MATLRDAARDLQVGLGVPAVAEPGRVGLQQLVEQRAPARVVARIGNAELLQAAVQPRQVLRQPERLAPAAFHRVQRHHLVDAVAEDETAIEHRHARLGQRHPLLLRKHAQIDDRIELSLAHGDQGGKDDGRGTTPAPTAYRLRRAGVVPDASKLTSC